MNLLKKFHPFQMALLCIGLLVLLPSCGNKDLKIPILKIDETCPSSYDSTAILATVKATGSWFSWGRTNPCKLSLTFDGAATSLIFDVPRLANNQVHQLRTKVLLGPGAHNLLAKVDINDDVTEPDELNNTKTLNFSVGYYPVLNPGDNLIYNESLASVLRGVIIDNNNINVPLGYYHIREFRKSNSPANKAIVLCFLKDYREMVNGNNVSPMSKEPWVFSIFEESVYVSGYIKYRCYDRSGHSLNIYMLFDNVKRCWNTKFQIDCFPYKMTTENYGSGQYNTCSPTSEHAWTELPQG